MIPRTTQTPILIIVGAVVNSTGQLLRPADDVVRVACQLRSARRKSTNTKTAIQSKLRARVSRTGLVAKVRLAAAPDREANQRSRCRTA